jgi:FtsP/CotA-like multicopper oxidase with cupredoxin domain
MERMQGREGDLVLVNGHLAPRVRARPGTLERWRVLNASPSRYQLLRVEGHVLHVIATDAGRIARPVARHALLLAPGERTEVLIDPGARGSYAVRSDAYDRGRAMGGMMGGRRSSRGRTIATLVVRGDGSSGVLPSRLPPTAPASAAPVSRRRTITLDMAMGRGMGGMMRGGAMDGTFTIDGRTFDPSRTDVRVGLDTVEEWTIENPTSMDHPFHLHVWPFEVLDGGGGAVISGGRKDTVNVPAGSSVVLRIPFTGLGGRTVYHCHILDHEDLGMMGVIDVS